MMQEHHNRPRDDTAKVDAVLDRVAKSDIGCSRIGMAIECDTLQERQKIVAIEQMVVECNYSTKWDSATNGAFL